MAQAFDVRRAARRGGHSDPAGRYGLLLLTLISTYLLSAFGSGRLIERLSVVLFAGVLLLALRTSPLSRRRTILLATCVLVGSAAAGTAALSSPRTGTGIADIWDGLVLLLTAVIIVRRVLARPTVTVQSIYGALSAYLIIGLMFAAFYGAIEHLGGTPFFAGHQPANTQTFQYFSFTTLTTLGYGDFTAAGNGGRAIAVIEALVGQVFLATLVARLVAAFRAPVERAGSAEPRRWPPPGAFRRDGATSYRRGSVRKSRGRSPGDRAASRGR
ncbi:MAG TPA: potassium channel family protein [Streptosporangiaceae bacterium]|nr:potassium channel family protein [Streptosporangiaceae bacterium]